MSAMKNIGDYSSLSHLFLICIHPSVFEMDALSLRKAVTPFKQLRASATIIQGNEIRHTLSKPHCICKFWNGHSFVKNKQTKKKHKKQQQEIVGIDYYKITEKQFNNKLSGMYALIYLGC